MNMLLYLIPIALFMGTLGLGAFLWSLKSGQFDDLEGASWRILADDDTPRSDQSAAGAVSVKPDEVP
ncbi:cbb3-type cytochrome oxidase assembly protein CcoS [Rhizobium jaguaris]|uniref:Cbb3-type cytochrome oxidase assembly protein CcoS n=1 Tax=Rhizobium jaguaris TaxID=1312183 RepID=A0A387G6R0_9HYPH|nr:cbb3-type cytochrome oxidase assembly protein CcoS [Rhizobium jaguaris]AYG63592.1 cbb3-type cytochrome oxidase assembly protein CcoS [Rhizobium jaguaris]